MGDVYAIYIRRSDKGEDDAEVSDHIQQETCLRRVPDGEPVEYFRDSGGDRRKNSGGTTDRAQYQRMLSWLRDDRLAAIVSYDDSRLNRNAENALSLYRECLALGVPIVTGVVPAEAVFSPEGELTYGITAVVAANQRAVSKKNAKERAERAWSNAEPHGADPFGYRTVKAWDERRREVQCGPTAAVGGRARRGGHRSACLPRAGDHQLTRHRRAPQRRRHVEAW